MRRADLTGQVLDDRYRVIEPIGEGAMGSVFRGERLKLGRMVAIKFLNDELSNEQSRRRFEREATAMAKLEHPHCGSVLDVGVHGDRPYVVMELVSGRNLKDIIASGPLPVARAVEITKQVLSGLSHAHEHGIIHRDIKPANIVLSQKSGMGDFVKILDFGLVRFQQDNTNLTGGMVLGTPNYMAPEQVKGAPLDQRVDLYACGVLLFELLTGEKPFQAKDPVAVCMLHINEPPPRLADKAPGRSFGALEGIVAKALAKNPDDRFSSADEFARALVAAAGTLDDVPSPKARGTVRTAAAAPSSPGDATVADAPAKRAGATRALMLLGGGVIAAGAVAAFVLATRGDAKATDRAAAPDQADTAPTEEASATADSPRAPERSPEAAAPPTTRPAVAAPPPDDPDTASSGDPVAPLLARARDAAAAGRREAALDLLLDARKTYPKDARLPYEASKLYLDKMWWADGLKQARAAIALDPAYRTDDELIKLVLKGFNTTKSYDWRLAKFMRDDVGAAAKPYLEDTAKNHPSAKIRSRATSELKRY